MPRPKYTVEETERGFALYSPLGEMIVSTYRVAGRRNPKYTGHAVDIPEHLEDAPQDEVLEWAIKTHERMVTTRRLRAYWQVEEISASPVWNVVTAVAVCVTAVVAVWAFLNA